MAYIDLDEYKNALNVFDLYADDQLQQCIDTATNIIKPLLATNSVGITHSYTDNGVIVFYTIRRHGYSIGDSVIVTQTSYNATYTVTAVGPFTFTVATNSTDSKRSHFYKPLGLSAIAGDYTYDDVPEVRTAAMMIAVDVFNAWTVPGGQAQGVDFQPGPYLMGRAIATRVAGLISRHRDPEGVVG